MAFRARWNEFVKKTPIYVTPVTIYVILHDNICYGGSRFLIFHSSFLRMFFIQKACHLIFGGMLSVDSCLESVFFQNLYQYGLCTLVYLYLSVYAELCQYGAGRQPFHADIPRQGLAEEDEQVFLHGILHAVQFVVPVQAVYLLSLIPVTEAVFQQCHRLGIDSGVVHLLMVVYLPDGDSEEASVSPYVLQAVPVVGTAYEGTMPGGG